MGTYKNVENNPLGQDQLAPGYFRIPNFVFELNLSAYALLILMYLLRCSNRHGQAWPSQSTIGKKCNIGSVKTVRAGLRELESEGLILIRQKNKMGARHPFAYQLSSSFKQMIDIANKKIDSEIINTPLDPDKSDPINPVPDNPTQVNLTPDPGKFDPRSKIKRSKRKKEKENPPNPPLERGGSLSSNSSSSGQEKTPTKNANRGVDSEVMYPRATLLGDVSRFFQSLSVEQQCEFDIEAAGLSADGPDVMRLSNTTPPMMGALLKRRELRLQYYLKLKATAAKPHASNSNFHYVMKNPEAH